jgi:hypothetical protein
MLIAPIEAVQVVLVMIDVAVITGLTVTLSVTVESQPTTL